MMQLLLPVALLLRQTPPNRAAPPIRPLVLAGERLTYDVTSARFGKVGRATLNTTLVDGTLRITFDSNLKILLFKASDHTVSELDADRLTTLRYTKQERSPIGKRDENVTIDRAAHTWTDGNTAHPLASVEALDELSIINLARALVLTHGQEVVLTRHFDRDRNPVRMRLLAAPADSMINNAPVDVIEMRVPDKRQNKGVSVLRFYLTRDARRVPVRIESAMPIAGRITMNLR